MKTVPPGFRSVTVQGKKFTLSLSQVNALAAIYDGIKSGNSEMSDSSAAAIAKKTFAGQYTVKDGRLVKKAKEGDSVTVPGGERPVQRICESMALAEPLTFEIMESADENSDHFRVTMIAIRAGWSQRKRYYKTKHLEQIKEFMDERRKMYLDHADPETGVVRRSSDWVAVIEKGRHWIGKSKDSQGVERDTLYVVVDVAKEGEGKVVRERIRKWPDQVRASIHAWATSEYGEAEGQKGDLTEDIVFFDSLDFVLYDSAGGGLSTGESEVPSDESFVGVHEDIEGSPESDQIVAQMDSLYWYRPREDDDVEKEHLSVSIRFDPANARRFLAVDEPHVLIRKPFREGSKGSSETQEDLSYSELFELNDAGRRLKAQQPTWGSVDKTDLPRAAFVDRGEPGKKSTWRYPIKYRNKSDNLESHIGGLVAAWQRAKGQGDTGILNKLRPLARRYGIIKGRGESEPGASTQGVRVVEDIKTVAELRAVYPGLVQEAENAKESDLRETFDADAQTVGLKANLEASRVDLKKAQEDAKTLEKETKEAAKSLQDKLDKLEADRVHEKHESFIFSELATAGFVLKESEGVDEAKVVPSVFLDVLKACEDENRIKDLIADRKAIVEAAVSDEDDKGMDAPADKGARQTKGSSKPKPSGKPLSEMSEDERKALARAEMIREDRFEIRV